MVFGSRRPQKLKKKDIPKTSIRQHQDVHVHVRPVTGPDDNKLLKYYSHQVITSDADNGCFSQQVNRSY